MNKFSRIYIEITNVCNLACSFCIKNSRKPRFMTCEEFARVLQQIRPYTSYICLHVLGEPLLHPQLASFLALAQEADMKVNVTTNGTMLQEKKQILLNAPALRKVSVSLHSLEGGSDAKEYLNGVADFVLAAAQSNILCDLRLWNLCAEDTDNEPIFEKLCQLLALDNAKIMQAKAKITETGSITLAPTVFLGTAPRFEWPSLSAPLTEKPIFCYGLRTQAAILCDGTVVPCCLDSRGDISLGNVFEQPFEQILQNPRVKAIYDGFSARRPSEELCKRCGYATRF